MEIGSLVGCFLVEKVLRPYQHGSALLEVRYEGSFVRGVLCVTDLSLYGGTESPAVTVQKINGKCATFAKAANVKTVPPVGVLLPTHVSFRESDGIVQVYGFFPKAMADAYLSGAAEPMPLDALGAAGQILTHVHRYGVGHGLLHPLAVRRAKEEWILPCPVFPFFPFSVENLSDDAITHDRKVFSLMVADALSGNTDGGSFDKRFESLATYVAAYPQIMRFLADKTVSFKELTERPASAPSGRPRKGGFWIFIFFGLVIVLFFLALRFCFHLL